MNTQVTGILLNRHQVFRFPQRLTKDILTAQFSILKAEAAVKEQKLSEVSYVIFTNGTYFGEMFPLYSVVTVTDRNFMKENIKFLVIYCPLPFVQ
jgi:hypothetical protein